MFATHSGVFIDVIYNPKQSLKLKIQVSESDEALFRYCPESPELEYPFYMLQQKGNRNNPVHSTTLSSLGKRRKRNVSDGVVLDMSHDKECLQLSSRFSHVCFYRQILNHPRPVVTGGMDS